MPFSSTDYITASPGSGGALLVVDNFTDPGDGLSKTLPFSGIAVGTYDGTYEIVGSAASLPVSIADPIDAVQSGTWLVDLQDSAGNGLLSATAAPGGSDRGLIVRVAGAVAQGTAAAAAAAWPVLVSDGTDTATFTTVSSKVGLDVNILGGAGGGSSLADSEAFVTGTTEMTVLGGIYLASPDTMSDATGGAVRMTSKRGLIVSMETPSGQSVLNDTFDAVVGCSAFPAAVTATLTTTGPTVSVACSGLGTVTMTLSGTCTSLDASFQASSDGGTTWIDIYAVQRTTNEFVASLSTLAMTSENISWQIDVAGFTHFRLNVTELTTSGTLTYRAQAISTAFTTNPGSAGGGGGTSMMDEAAFTVGTTAITPAGGTYKSSRDSVSDGDGGCLAMTATRGLFVSPETPTGGSVCDDSDDAIKTVSPDNSVANIVSASGTNVTEIKASAGVLSGYSAFNNTASPIFMRFYDVATVTVGASAVKFGPVMIPANGGANSMSSDMKIQFGTKLQVAFTTGMADTDTTGIAAEDACASFLYR